MPARRVPPACPPAREEDGQPDGTQAEARGLSTCHISPHIEIYSGASYLKAVKPDQQTEKDEQETEEPEKAKRGKIIEFTKKSRLRMMRELSKVRRDKMPVFITLTYPAEWELDSKLWKRHLDNFLKRLFRKYPNAAGVWKLEPQKRGAPHFHLLVWNLFDSDQRQAYLNGKILSAGAIRVVKECEFQNWLSEAWYQVVGSGDEKHLRAGTRVEPIKSSQGVMFYASKYIGKEVLPDNWGYTGRWWGIFRRDNLPYGEFVSVLVSPEKAQEFIRYMRRFAHIRSRDYKSLTIICNPDFWVNRLL